MAALCLALGLALAGCSAPDDSRPAAGSPTTPAVRTLAPLPPPPTRPPTGRLYADLRQSSRDVALGRVQVWIRNDTRSELDPTRLAYRDRRFRTVLQGERLRPVPAGSERGYPLTLPRTPWCGRRADHGTLAVEHRGGRAVISVDDPTDAVGRYRASRCAELAVARVARLRWEDEVGLDGTLVLSVEPTGRDPGRLRILTVGGTPLLGPVGASHWTVRRTVRAGGSALRVPLEVRPVRCDAHVFMESAGATTFRVRLVLDGRPASLALPMTSAGSASVLGYARRACGLD